MKNPRAILNAVCRIDDKLTKLTLSCKDENTIIEIIKITTGDLENLERALEFIISAKNPKCQIKN